MFNRIVVGVDGLDGGRDAIALAKALAADNADIVLLTAIAYEASQNRDWIDYSAPMREETSAMLESAASGDDRCRTRVIADWSPGRALHQVADEMHADLIVVGSAHRGPVGRLILGDVSRSTLHGAPCAVAVAPRGFRERPRDTLSTIGVGVNGTRESDAALEAAAQIAADTGARLHLLCAVAIPAAFAATYAYAYDWTEIEADSRRVAEQQLAEIAKSLDVPVEIEALGGNAGKLLEKLSEDVDLIVAGSRGWGAAKAVVLGSTTNRLVHHAHCPVMVIPSPVAVAVPKEALHA